MTNYTFSLPERRETSKRWDFNQIINSSIEAAFRASIHEFDEAKFADSENFELSSPPILTAELYKDVPYGGKTLGEAGCAVFALEQGLHYRFGEPVMQIEELAKYVADLDYYEYGKGTYHNLFDHYGLRRATHVDDVIYALYMDKMVTVLVRNCDYSPLEKNEGSHFINLVGKSGKNFSVADSQLDTQINVPAIEIFKATRVAWIW